MKTDSLIEKWLTRNREDFRGNVIDLPNLYLCCWVLQAHRGRAGMPPTWWYGNNGTKTLACRICSRLLFKTVHMTLMSTLTIHRDEHFAEIEHYTFGAIAPPGFNVSPLLGDL